MNELHDLKIQQKKEVSRELEAHLENDAYEDKMRIKEFYELKKLCQELQNELEVKEKLLAEKDDAFSKVDVLDCRLQPTLTSEVFSVYCIFECCIHSVGMLRLDFFKQSTIY